MIITLIILVGIGVAVFSKPLFGEELTLGNSASNAAIDLVGTRTGTSTAGADFSVFKTASSSYIAYISGDTDTAIISLKATAASTTGTAVYMNILASNDEDCITASTTYNSPYNNIVVTDINWYDATSHIKNITTATVASMLTAATTTIVWQPANVGIGKEIILTDLNANCLRLNINATSTKLYGQLRTKQR